MTTIDDLHATIGGRVWHALDLGLPLDDLDHQRIREALAMAEEVRSKEKCARQKMIALIGRLDVMQGMDRAAIDRTIDDLLAAMTAAGWNPPTPNSRR